MSDCGNCRRAKRKNKLLLKLANALDGIMARYPLPANAEPRAEKLLIAEAREEGEK